MTESIDIGIMSPSAARQAWLQRSIGREQGIRVVAVAATFPLLRSLLNELATDLVLIDSASDMEPNIIREWLVELIERVPILLFSSDPDPATFNLLVNGKTGGMLSTDASPEQ